MTGDFGPDASLLGRVWDPAAPGPCVVTLRGDVLVDITTRDAPTVRDLLEADDPAAAVRDIPGRPIGSLDAIAAASRDGSNGPRLLAPCDLQALKACGVTFARSMVERVIEERAAGDPDRAEAIRARIAGLIGANLRDIHPGSPEAAAAKAALQAEGLWSQYLEVGIGPDAEVFTKGQPMSAVGWGATVGLHPASRWNNPEPEVVLAVDSRGRIRGATLGNDVNLRDIEGRSALLLGKAKDNNAACAIGPFIRLFDDGFTLDDVRAAELTLTVEGKDGFRLDGRSSMKRDQPRPRRPRRPDDRPPPPVPGRLHALPRHHVRARPGPRRSRPGLHPPSGRRRHHRRPRSRRASSTPSASRPRRPNGPSARPRSCATSPPGAASDRPGPRRRRRLGVRALARQLLPRGPAAEARARVREPPAHHDRDQRHLLRLAEARELRPLARGDPRRLRLRGQGPALRHQPPGAGRGRAVGRALLLDRRHGAPRRSSARSTGSSWRPRSSTSTTSPPSSRCCRSRSRAARSATPSRSATRASAPRSSSRSPASTSVAIIVALESRLSADRRRHRPLRLRPADGHQRRPRGRARPRGRRAWADRAREPGPTGAAPDGLETVGAAAGEARRATSSSTSSAAPRSAIRRPRWR